MVWADADIFEMIDSSLTSEDSRRVPAAHCSHPPAYRSKRQSPQCALDGAGERRAL